MQMTEQKVKSQMPARVRTRLESVRDCRREMARLYRATREGRLDASVATKLGFLLDKLVGMIRDDDLEARVTRLETRYGPET